MQNKEMRDGSDPYQSAAQNLNTGDSLNRWILERPRQKIVEILKGQRVLDVCCGTGNLTAMLAAAGCQVVGVDSSPTMLSHARGKHLAADFKLMDAAQLPFHQEFDAGVISLALHEMPPQTRELVWESMVRAVRPGGRLIALDFTLPERSSITAKIAAGLIEQDERSTLSYDPGHYQNFREFMQSGGLLSWIQKQRQPLEAVYRYWSGTIGLVIASQAGTLPMN